MNFELAPRTIFLVVSGSRSYGFSNPDSDWDYRGIAIPPMGTYIGLESKFEHCVDTDKGKHVYKHFPEGLVVPDADMQILELTKFCGLAAQCNPSIIEILFTDPKFFIKKHPIMNKILEKKDFFLSKQVKARFCGYALSQLKRIQRHKRWLDNPPTKQPLRSEFGLPEYKLLSLDQLGAAESLIKKEIDEFIVDQTFLPEDVKIELSNGMSRMMRAIWHALNSNKEYPVGDGKKFATTESALFEAVAEEQGFSDNFMEVLKAEKKYRAAKQEWDSYQKWLKDRNPARAELEKKFGYDSKHAAHLVRLIRMAREILETGKVLVHRPDADEIRAIRNGAWSYEEVVSFAEREDLVLNDVVRSSVLPKTPPIKEIHELVFEMVMQFNTKGNSSQSEEELSKMIYSLLLGHINEQ